jgi:hypothetical protein
MIYMAKGRRRQRHGTLWMRLVNELEEAKDRDHGLEVGRHFNRCNRTSIV